jgi:gamma-glutamylcyclotransferase (GGCT)/AIG2-like uncharacterized protein YtfP
VFQISHGCPSKSIFARHIPSGDIKRDYQIAMTSHSNSVQTVLTQVAVYGTLKRGLCNHHLMRAAPYLGSDRLHEITLYDLGPYPGAKLEASDGIVIEVYAVSAAQLAGLDALEEYNAEAPEQGMYNRVLVQTRFGPAWVYIYNPSVNELTVQRQGSWLPAQTQVLR